MTFADGPRSPCTDRRPYRGVAHGYRAVGSAGGAGEAGRNDVGSVPIQRNTGAVIPHSGPRVTVRGGFLNVAQRHAGVEGCGDERVAQGVWADRLANAGPLGGPAHDPAGPGDSVEVGLRLHPTKTTVVYCKDGRRRGSYEHTDFTFLGFTFRARGARSRAGVNFTAFGPGDQQARSEQGERPSPPLAAARAHPRRTRTTDQSDRAWLDAVLRGVQPHSPVSTPAAHQRLPGALAPTEILTTAAIQESQSLLATHHPPAAETIRPLGMDSRILVINDDKSRMSREAHVLIRGSRGLKRPGHPPGSAAGDLDDVGVGGGVDTRVD